MKQIYNAKMGGCKSRVKPSDEGFKTKAVFQIVRVRENSIKSWGSTFTYTTFRICKNHDIRLLFPLLTPTVTRENIEWWNGKITIIIAVCNFFTLLYLGLVLQKTHNATYKWLIDHEPIISKDDLTKILRTDVKLYFVKQNPFRF